ncbi:MAG: mechanosensitive ion channel [Flavobacteriales bacterium]|nr:mechanosensitive ion channel [Flavobacteriales bacterium]
MSDFFNYSFYQTDLLNITVGKLLSLIFIIFITRLILRFYRVFVHKKIRALDVFDKEREALFLKAGKNVIRLLGVIAAVMSLGLMPLLNAIFAFPLLTTEKVHVSVGNVFVLIIILVITRILARLVRIIIKKNFSRKAWVDEGKEYTVFKLTKYGLYGFAILVGLTSIGIDMKLILAGAGALLVGIGFGLQYLFYDLISGLIILFEGPIKVGDVIEVDGLVAKVKQIDIRTSKVITRNGKYIIIPNSKLIGEKVVNWSHGSELTRFNVEVGVKYGSDTALVKEVLYNCVLRHPDVSKNREIIVRFDNFGDSALIFTVFFWAKKTWVVETLQSEIRFEVDREFREKGITVPFPQRDIHIISNPDSK